MANWYFQLMGTTIGPISDTKLRENALKGQITAETLIRRDGTDRSVTADRVNGLLDPPPAAPALQNTPVRISQAASVASNTQSRTEITPMPNANSATKEYKVLTQKDKWFSGKFDPAKLEEALNAYAEQGWIVKAASTAAITGLLSGNRDEMFIIMER